LTLCTSYYGPCPTHTGLHLWCSVSVKALAPLGGLAIWVVGCMFLATKAATALCHLCVPSRTCVCVCVCACACVRVRVCVCACVSDLITPGTTAFAPNSARAPLCCCTALVSQLLQHCLIWEPGPATVPLHRTTAATQPLRVSGPITSHACHSVLCEHGSRLSSRVAHAA
jgi:hypothetical protein